MPGEPLVRVYTPTFDQDGYESTHTIAEIVTDDMPFLVDSVGMELTRHGVGIHLVVHPIIGVRRDDRGHLIDLDEDGPREAFMHFEVDRETDPAAFARAAGGPAARARGRPRRRRRLGRDAHASGGGSRCAHGSCGRRDRVSPRLDGRRPLHVPRLSQHAGTRFGLGPPPRRRRRRRRSRRPRRCHGAQGRRQGNSAPPGRDGAGLCRAAPVPRSVVVGGVQHVATRDPPASPEGRNDPRSLGPAAGLPLWEGPRGDPGDVSPRRALPDRRGGATHDGDGDPEPARAPARAAVSASGRPQPLLLVPRVRAPRSVHHRAHRAHRGDPRRCSLRHERRQHGERLRVRARTRPRDRVDRRGRDAGDAGRSRHRSGTRRRGPVVGRRLRHRARGAQRRGARPRPPAPLPRRVSRGVPRGRPSPQCGRRRGSHRIAAVGDAGS